MQIIIPIIVVGSLGLLFGLGLAIASKKFCVVTDPNLEKLLGCLPGANCGACGMPGCMGFAEALIKGQISLETCKVMEADEKGEAASILGIELKTQAKTVAVLHCAGGVKVKDRFEYNGLEDCTACSLVSGGHKQCLYGCLGLGTCEKVCPFDAIRMSEDGLALVDVKKCRACGKCVEACPKKLFSLAPVKSRVHVLCSSHDTGRDTRRVCPVGCIACGKCQKACPVDAIHVVDNLAIIDYDKCTSCGACVQACPMKCIIMSEDEPEEKEG